jgi:heme a synthase
MRSTNVVFRRLDGFQKLALATTATTYLLILVGGLVRAAGAGMGCPDWPRCFGLWIPPTRADQLPAAFDPARFNAALTWIEYVNRLLGVATGLLILATLVAAFVKHRRSPEILWPSVAAFLAVGYQGWLGGRVVAHGLAPWIVTVHLVVALVIVSLLLYATVNAFFSGRSVGPADEQDPVAAWLGPGLILLTLFQVALGTQVRSGVDRALALGIPRGGLLDTVGGVDTLHRATAVCVFALAVWLWSRIQGHGSVAVAWSAIAVVSLASLQIIAGIALARFALPRPIQVVHLSVASLLLGAETLLALLSRRLGSGASFASAG